MNNPLLSEAHHELIQLRIEMDFLHGEIERLKTLEQRVKILEAVILHLDLFGQVLGKLPDIRARYERQQDKPD